MAAIVRRPRRGGTAYQVRWRQDGAWQSDTFDTERKALRFKCEVEDAGNRWPPGWVPGYGYVVASEPQPPPAAAPAATAFAELAERYLLTRTSVSAYQLTRYRSMVHRLGERFPVVEDVDDEAIAAWVRDSLDGGTSPKTIANYHGLLHGICGHAVRKGLLAANPCALTRLPKVSAYDADGEPVACFLEPSEFALVAEAMCAAGAYHWRPPGGPGERRKPPEIATCGVAYREAATSSPSPSTPDCGGARSPRCGSATSTSGAGGWRSTGPGSGMATAPGSSARRRPPGRGGRCRWRRRWSSCCCPTSSGRPRLTCSATPAGTRCGRTCSTSTAGSGRSRWPASRGLLKRPRFHDLRHTHVAWLIAGGTPLPKIQARLGHESIQTTIDVYGGLLADTDDQLDAVVSAAFTAVTPPAGAAAGADRLRSVRTACRRDASNGQPALF